LQTPSDFERTFLRTDDPRAESGFHGSAERWEMARPASRRSDRRTGNVPGRRLRERLADGVGRGAAKWAPPFRFDFVHVRIEIGPLDRVRGFGERLIVSSDGSFRRPDSARLQPVAERLLEFGLDVAGQIYRRSDEHQVEIVVAWVDG
jgi:hypothetical protein